MLTPVLAYLRIRKTHHYSFLLESVEGIGRLARYSFIGMDPIQIIENRGMDITIRENGKQKTIRQNLFEFLKNAIATSASPKLDNLPDFTGGIVGYLGYENVALVEDVLAFQREAEFDSPDSLFGIYPTIIAFDHYKHQLLLIHNVRIDAQTDLSAVYHQAQHKLHGIWKQLIQPATFPHPFRLVPGEADRHDRNTFYETVEKAKQNIYDGEVFQIVLSRRFNQKYEGDLINVYRALRIINPSPYMYFMELGADFTIIGTSPEDLLKVRSRTATILPIAGTRKRGKTAEADSALEADLLNDPKELAEHVMLVDLARNDLGKISQIDSVRIVEKMNVHRFSHVMHLVSRVEGQLKAGTDCIDALMAAFPAGTLTGAPKIRAMQLIESYETIRRNVYGGAIGYIDFNGNLDMCIAIRTLFARNKKIYWQAGAGIVADSHPESEWNEIENKAAVLNAALKYAEVIDEDIDH